MIKRIQQLTLRNNPYIHMNRQQPKLVKYESEPKQYSPLMCHPIKLQSELLHIVYIDT